MRRRRAGRRVAPARRLNLPPEPEGNISLGPAGYVYVGLAGLAAGAVNAMAGGGTLISFPVLVGVGLSSLRANVTNLIALTPGYVAGTVAQRHDLVGQEKTLRALLLPAAAGGLLGSVVLVLTSAATFRAAVPFLIVFACFLLVVQDRVRLVIVRHGSSPGAADAGRRPALWLCVFLSAVYGGFFGAGLGIMLLAVLGLFSDERLVRLNAVKQSLSFVISLVAAIFLAVRAHVAWGYVAVLMPTSVVGAAAGGRLVRRISPRLLRVVVVLVGLGVAIRYWA